MNIGWPQGIMLALMLLSSGKSIALFGKPKKPDTHDIVDVLIGPLISIGLLYWGGFFS